MSDARSSILGAIAQSLDRGAQGAVQRTERASRLSPPFVHTLPKVTDNLVDRFVSGLEQAAGSYTVVNHRSRITAEIESYLQTHHLGHKLVAAPALKDLTWSQDLQVRFGIPDKNDQTSVTACFAAIAETGSLVFLSGPEHPTSLNFLPETHVVITQTDAIVRHIEDVWLRIRQQAIEMPRTINVVTGPSRTADIEQTMQLGAHGPRRLHVILVESSAE